MSVWGHANATGTHDANGNQQCGQTGHGLQEVSHNSANKGARCAKGAMRF